MDQSIITQWNSQVQPDDVVYVLGDFSFHPARYLHKLAGTKILIMGNHDPLSQPKLALWAAVYDTLMWTAQTSKARFYLSHYPHRIWPSMHHGTRHLYGHVHGEILQDIPGARDVGWEAAGFRLLSEHGLHRELAVPTLVDAQAEMGRQTPPQTENLNHE